MTKIWAKIVINHSVRKSVVHDCGEKIHEFNFYNNVREICEQLKIPTPVILETYIRTFLDFNILKFKQRDFLEEINFDQFVLESGE